MKAVFKRELRSYFASPIGYVCVAALLALYGFYYFQVMMMGSTSYITSAYNAMFTFCMMIIPIITMRSMTDDRKNKTDQALLTAPVGTLSIVIGKFLSSFFVYFIASTLGLLPAVALSFFSTPPWGVVLGNYVGTLLYGGAMVAIVVFISSLTVSQIIAAIGTFAVAVFLMFIDSLASGLSSSWVSAVVGWISFNTRYTPFTQGLFNVSSAIFFLSVMAVFVFLTARKVESRRWS